jgi:hypothetical protein
VRGTKDVRPQVHEAALAVEELQAVVLAIADDDVLIVIECEPVRQMKLPGAGADLAPRVEQLPFGVEVMDACVAVAVCNEDVAVA